jgi:hypothetical protein
MNEITREQKNKFNDKFDGNMNLLIVNKIPKYYSKLIKIELKPSIFPIWTSVVKIDIDTEIELEKLGESREKINAFIEGYVLEAINDRYNRTTVFQNWNDDNPPSLINSSSYKQNNVTKLPVKTSITGVF